MRELDLETPIEAHAPAPEAGRDAGGSSAAAEARGVEPSDRLSHLSIDVIGPGRAGTTLALGLDAAGHDVSRPLARGEAPRPGLDLILLCVPDSSIAELDSALDPSLTVGHCCGAHGARILDRRRGFSLHPLMTLDGDPSALSGAFAAVDGTGPDELALARRLTVDLGMEPLEVAADDRTAYHAAASIASNFLITLEAAAERLAMSAGVPRRALVPLVGRTVANWSRDGGPASLTGPVARGDHGTVALQRREVELRAPELIPLFDSLCEATAELAGTGGDR